MQKRWATRTWKIDTPATSLFCDRIHGEGKDLQDCIFDDMFAYGSLPDPPRTKAQISAGVAANAQNENCLSKLIFMSQPRGVDGFQLSSAKHGRRSGVSCLAATFLQRMNMSATSAVVAHSVAC